MARTERIIGLFPYQKTKRMHVRDRKQAAPPWLTKIRKETHDVFEAEIRDTEVALLDIPTHMNVGDTMIWCGELEYLQRLGITVKYTADIARYSKRLMDMCTPHSPILLHGGGNFGDTWPEFQAFREAIAIENPHRQIVQLPQTVRFASAENAERANRIFGQHPEFMLMVRDSESLAHARASMPNVRSILCADMAFGITMLRSSRTGPRNKVTVLSRTDHEQKHCLAEIGHPPEDWHLSLWERVAWGLARIPGSVARRIPGGHIERILQPGIRFGYSCMRNINMRSGKRIVSSGEVLVTDRLHAHVLAGLLGVPNVVLDNNYGKISRIFREYSHSFEASLYVDSVEKIAAALDELAKTKIPSTGGRI